MCCIRRNRRWSLSSSASSAWPGLHPARCGSVYAPSPVGDSKGMHRIPKPCYRASLVPRCVVASGRMLTSDCPFCEHKNSVGAKFCNECGSPLSLAPCKRCGAINNLMDAECQRCGAPLLRPRAPGEPAQTEAESARVGGESRTLEQDIALIEQRLLELGDVSESPTLPDVATAVQPKHAASESGQAPGSPTFPDLAVAVQLKQGVPGLVQEDSTHPGGATVTQVKQGAPELGQMPGSPTLRGPETAARVEEAPRKHVRNRGAESPFTDPWMPPLRARVDARWQEPLAIAMFVVAIAGGGYLSYRLGALPARETFTAWLGWLRADAPAEPRAASDAPPVVAPGGIAATPSPVAPVEPRAATDAPPVGASGGAGATPSPAPRAIIAPREPAAASDVPPVSAKGPAPAAAPQPSCPPAVAAMALCHAYRP